MENSNPAPVWHDVDRLIVTGRTSEAQMGRELTQSRNKTDTITSEETPSDEKRLSDSGRLQNDTEVEDQAGRGHEAPSTSEQVTERSSSESAEEGSS